MNGSQKNTPPDVTERVLKVIALTKRLPREAVTLDSSFESLGVDSLDRLNILFDLESEFDIEINDEDAKRVENIPQMIAGVVALVNAKHTVTGHVFAETPPVHSDPLHPSAHPTVSASEPAPELDAATKPASSGE